MVTLMLTLRSLHLLLDHLDLLIGLLHNLISNYCTLTRFVPAQRYPTPPTIQRLKRGYPNTQMKIIIVSELDQRQVGYMASGLVSFHLVEFLNIFLMMFVETRTHRLVMT